MRPQLGLGNQVGTQRVAFDISAKYIKVCVVLDWKALESRLVNVSIASRVVEQIYLIFPKPFGKDTKESIIIIWFVEDGSTGVPAIESMVDHPRLVDTLLSRHIILLSYKKRQHIASPRNKLPPSPFALPPFALPLVHVATFVSHFRPTIAQRRR